MFGFTVPHHKATVCKIGGCLVMVTKNRKGQIMLMVPDDVHGVCRNVLNPDVERLGVTPADQARAVGMLEQAILPPNYGQEPIP
jgi:hypothetical protein